MDMIDSLRWYVYPLLLLAPLLFLVVERRTRVMFFPKSARSMISLKHPMRWSDTLPIGTFMEVWWDVCMLGILLSMLAACVHWPVAFLLH